MKRYCSLLAFAVFFLLFGLMPAAAQVSLGAGDQADVTVSTDAGDETFTVLRDYARRDQFYYVPNKPQLATRGRGDKKKPVFHLLKYQAKNNDTNELVEGGILQFAVRLAPEAGVVDKIKEKVATQFSLPLEGVKISPLPFKTAEVTIYDQEGEMLTTCFQKPGIAPAFANAEIPFQVQLTSLSADVYDALTRGSGGIPLYITYTFDQISAPTGFKVTVDWDQSHKHFSEDKRTKTAYTRWYYYRTWWGGWRGRGETGQNESREETLSDILQENSSIKHESVAGKNFTQEEITKYMDPVIERVTKELVEKMTPPEKIEAAAAKEPQDASHWGGSSTYAMKKSDKVKKGKEVIEFSRREIFETKSTYGTLLGIGEYDDKIQRDLITIMPAGEWSYAFFPVPAIGDGEELNLSKVSLQVIPKYYDNAGRLKQIPGLMAELVEWTADNGCFVDRKRNEVTNILFPMQAIVDKLKKDGVPLASCTYEVTTRITQGKENMEFKSYEDFLLGGLPVSSPMARIEGVMVDCEPLTFGTDSGELYMVSINVKPTFPKKTYNATIKADTDNKCPVFLVEKQDQDKKNPITATINFTLKGQSKKVPWQFNGRNLQDEDLGLSVVLWDEDYQVEK